MDATETLERKAGSQETGEDVERMRLQGRRHRVGRGGLRAVGLGLMVLGFTGMVAACDGLLDVELPTRVPASILEDPGMATTLVLGVQNDFECFYSNYVAGSGLFTQELLASTEFFGYNQIATRQITSGLGNDQDCVYGNAFSLFLPMFRANWVAADAVRRLGEFTDAEVPGRSALMARAYMYAGFTLTLMGEGYCQGVVEEEGPVLDPSGVLAAAEERFTQAITLAESANAAETLNGALVGRARVRNVLGNSGGARADAERVPEGFVLHATYSAATALRENQLQVNMFRDEFVSVAPPFIGLEVEGVADPRVAVTERGRPGPDGRTPYITADKYADGPSAPIRLASWVEAQLIIAESALGEEAVARINALRRLHDLPDYVPVEVTDAAEIRAQILEERRREFFLEGHRLGDMLRAGIPFPQGVDHKGTLFSDRTCLPLAQREVDNNPNA